MRTVSLGILAIIIAISVMTPGSFSAGSETRRNYVDSDNDGVCDYSGNNCIYANTNENGICGGYGHGMTRPGCGRNFTDTDGDGICDNYTGEQPARNGHGCGFRGGHCR